MLTEDYTPYWLAPWFLLGAGKAKISVMMVNWSLTRKIRQVDIPRRPIRQLTELDPIKNLHAPLEMEDHESLIYRSQTR